MWPFKDIVFLKVLSQIAPLCTNADENYFERICQRKMIVPQEKIQDILFYYFQLFNIKFQEHSKIRRDIRIEFGMTDMNLSCCFISVKLLTHVWIIQVLILANFI